MKKPTISMFVLTAMISLISLGILSDRALAAQCDAEKCVYVSDGQKSRDFWVGAGGTACCGCWIEHSGTLPEDFPSKAVSSVTFYLTDSRSNSYYTQVAHGSTQIKFVLGGIETVASSQTVEEAGITLPEGLNVPWIITFTFATPVSVVPGETEWKILDVDDNPFTYAAVWLHMSDVQDNGLKGRLRQGGCQYNEDMDAWYSVRFDFAEEDHGPATCSIETDLKSCVLAGQVTRVRYTVKADGRLTDDFKLFALGYEITDQMRHRVSEGVWESKVIFREGSYTAVLTAIIGDCEASTEVSYLSASTCEPVLYVDGEVAGSGNGRSWDQAFKTIQEAVASAQEGDEIWVKAGNYQVDSYIWVDKGVKIYGGFAGDESERNDASRRTRHTIVSGGAQTLCFDVSAEATIDGFDIIDCRGDYGGGMMIVTPDDVSSPISPVISNCLFTNNHARHSGGAIYVEKSAPWIINSKFIENTAQVGGGAIQNLDSYPVMVNALFGGNSADLYGSAIWNYNANLLILQSTFSENYSSQGVALDNTNSNATVFNAILWGNHSGSGPNPLQIRDDPGSHTEIWYSDVQNSTVNGPGHDEPTCMDSDPLFVGQSDFRLKATSPCIDAGVWDSQILNTLLAPFPGKVMENADKLVTHDADYQARPVDGNIDGQSNTDMGAYEYQPAPVPDLKVNGLDQSVSLNDVDSVQVRVALKSWGRTSNVDLWVACEAYGQWYSFSLKGWQAGIGVGYQGPLIELAETEILNLSYLPPGQYDFYFAVDEKMNGSFDAPYHIDTVSVTVNKTFIPHPTNGHSYKLAQCGTWTQCASYAVSKGAHLVTINDSAEYGWLRSKFGTHEEYWIGYTDRVTEGTWKWVSGETANFHPWASGEPSNGDGFLNKNEDYAVMNWEGTYYWNDLGPSSSQWDDVKKAILEKNSQ